MTKGMSIPRTTAEAERFLWHALFYLGYSLENKAAQEILASLILELQEAQR